MVSASHQGRHRPSASDRRALIEMTKEMDVRYERFAKAGVRKIEEYNVKYPEERLPYVVIVIDELPTLCSLRRARWKRRSCGSRNSRARPAFISSSRRNVRRWTLSPGSSKRTFRRASRSAVSSQTDLCVILDRTGAERLLGPPLLLTDRRTEAGSRARCADHRTGG